MDRLVNLFIKHFGEGEVVSVPLTGSASNRKYFRLSRGSISCIGVEGTCIRENLAFISFAGKFAAAGLPVPEIYAVSEDGTVYLQEDLGDITLFDMKNSTELLCRTMSLLPKLQFEGGKAVDYELCHTVKEFSRMTAMFDLNYFKYCFLKPSGLEFDEVRLQEEFERFAEELQCGDDRKDTFLYRDFQARNVMIKDGQPYFIDFQGGYRGPVYYDVASFIWHARASYPEDVRNKMLDSYLDALAGYVEVSREDFCSKLKLFVLFRYLQVLGAYGFRGLVEQKSKFVVAIPALMQAVRDFLDDIPQTYPYMRQILGELVSLPRFAPADDAADGLEVEIYSFSFKKGIPYDRSGNGGGYVFDCRGLSNPGRYPQYRHLTGRDEAVIRFLEEDGGVFSFLDNVYGVVEPHIEDFLRRGFSHLMVSFGCTGGQHRSVYCAEHLAQHLREKYPDIHIRLTHREH